MAPVGGWLKQENLPSTRLRAKRQVL